MRILRLSFALLPLVLFIVATPALASVTIVEERAGRLTVEIRFDKDRTRGLKRVDVSQQPANERFFVAVADGGNLRAVQLDGA
jgi:hypothetical protein